LTEPFISFTNGHVTLLSLTREAEISLPTCFAPEQVHQSSICCWDEELELAGQASVSVGPDWAPKSQVSS